MLKATACATLAALSCVGGPALPGHAQPASDIDSDGTPDVFDICMLDPTSPSPNFCDTDMDGYGNKCDADLTNDGIVGGPDLGMFSMSLGTTGAPGFVAADILCDGVVTNIDGGLFYYQFGGPPGPSGLACAGTVPCP